MLGKLLNLSQTFLFPIRDFNGIFKTLNEIIDTKSICLALSIESDPQIVKEQQYQKEEPYLLFRLSYPSVTDANSPLLEKVKMPLNT